MDSGKKRFDLASHLLRPGDSFGLKLTSEDLSIGFHYAF